MSRTGLALQGVRRAKVREDLASIEDCSQSRDALYNKKKTQQKQNRSGLDEHEKLERSSRENIILHIRIQPQALGRVGSELGLSSQQAMRQLFAISMPKNIYYCCLFTSDERKQSKERTREPVAAKCWHVTVFIARAINITITSKGL